MLMCLMLYVGQIYLFNSKALNVDMLKMFFFTFYLLRMHKVRGIRQSFDGGA